MSKPVLVLLVLLMMTAQGPAPSAEENDQPTTPVQTIDQNGLPTPQGFCTMQKTNGVATSTVPWSIGEGVYTYFDPQLECSAGSYPFEITNFQFMLDPSGLFPAVLDIVVYDPVLSGDKCSGPGLELFRQPFSADLATFGFPNWGTFYFPFPMQVIEPFFIGIEFQSTGPQSLMCDSTLLPNSCDNWIRIGPFEEWNQFFGSPPGAGYPLFRVGGDAQDTSDTYRVSIDGDFGGGPGLIPVGTEIRIPLRYTNLNYIDDNFAIAGAWRISSPDSAVWQTHPIEDLLLPVYRTPFPGFPLEQLFFDDLFSDVFPLIRLGNGEDSVGYAGIVFPADTGLFDGFNYNGLAISLSPDPASLGRTICIDTITDQIGGYEWQWNNAGGSGSTQIPQWPGPYCFTIVPCGDVDGSGGVTTADLTLLIDQLFVSGEIPPQSADLDGCNLVDVADLYLLFDQVFVSQNQYCEHVFDCNPNMPDDLVELRVVRRPNAQESDFGIQIDLYGLNTVPISGMSMGFSWDLRKLILDSVVTSPEVDFQLDGQSQAGGNDSTRQLTLWGVGLGGSLIAPNENKRWASYYFTAPTWDRQDSVTFYLDEWSNGSRLKFAATLDDSLDFVGYVPQFAGPVTVRDAERYGDVDGNGITNLADIGRLIDYLYKDESFDAPVELGNVDLCDGVDIADLMYLIERVFLFAPPISEPNCDNDLLGDSLGMRFTSTPGWEAGSPKAVTGETLELELLVGNANDILGATMGFAWSAKNPNNPGEISHLNLQLDSAKGTALTITGFDNGLEFFEDGNLATSNNNSQFQFVGSASGGSGVGGNPGQRLWASYFFTLTNFQDGDIILIDTTEYSDGTTFKMASGELGGHEAEWDPEIIFDCCGSYTAGRTGNVNWEFTGNHFRCDPSGVRNLADISRLIDFVYISHEDLCCFEDGNVDGDIDGKANLADITLLIDHVYITKEETESCL